MKKSLALIIFFSLVFSQALAQTPARVFITGHTGSVALGSEIVLSVMVDTDEPINALELSLRYSGNLEFINSDNSNSIVDIWQTKPSASSGVVNLSGGLLEAFSGTGNIIKLAFKTISAGNAEINFTISDLYLADGMGTKSSARGEGFNFAVEESGTPVFEESTPFESTPSDVFIAQELQSYEEDLKQNKYLGPIIVIILVFGFILLYNRKKRDA